MKLKAKCWGPDKSGVTLVERTDESMGPWEQEAGMLWQTDHAHSLEGSFLVGQVPLGSMKDISIGQKIL